MFWDKKEKRGLPELPPIRPSITPESQGEHDEDEEILEKHALPAFPDSPLKKGFSQTAIKEAVGEEKEPLPEISDMPLPSKIRELDEPTHIEPFPTSKPEKSTQDVYIKLDKFHSARKALKSAKEKVQEIETLLNKIRDVKMREEHELASWEENINSVKAKIEEVTNNIFEKVE